MPVNEEKENLKNDLINKIGIAENEVKKYTNIDYNGIFNDKYMNISLTIIDYEKGIIDQEKARSKINNLFD